MILGEVMMDELKKHPEELRRDLSDVQEHPKDVSGLLELMFKPLQVTGYCTNHWGKKRKFTIQKVNFISEI